MTKKSQVSRERENSLADETTLRLLNEGWIFHSHSGRESSLISNSYYPRNYCEAVGGGYPGYAHKECP